jgi:hypothetical protein
VAVNGEISATKFGRDMHKAWDYGPGFEKELTLPSGKRVDGINFDTRQIRELKPDNPRAIRLGERQVAGYVDELNQAYPGDVATTAELFCLITDLLDHVEHPAHALAAAYRWRWDGVFGVSA